MLEGGVDSIFWWRGAQPLLQKGHAVRLRNQCIHMPYSALS